ncbi:MAG TPA: T9SS type A sorting domain-containing protein, partial [Saprospiraceae bacterium]|nr:T9SS type A sorting domain-containing protein [Saprospiraceae bacterium]
EGVPKKSKLYITDPTGHRLQSYIVPDQANSINLNLDILPPGLYFVEILYENNLLKVAKLVKE